MPDANVRTSDPRNYQLPGSVSMWTRLKGTTGPYEDLGNIINPNIEQLIEELEHFSQRRGLRAKDKEVISQREAQLRFSLDEFNVDNLRKVFGQKESEEVGSYTAHFNKVAVNPGSALTINLGQVDISGVVVRGIGLETPVTYVEGVGNDYTVNLATGVLTILAGGDLEDESVVPEIHVYFEKVVETKKFSIFPGTAYECAVKFQVFTPGGIKYAIEFANAVIRSDGAFTIGDGTAWQEAPLRMDVLADADGELGTMHVVDDGEVA